MRLAQSRGAQVFEQSHVRRVRVTDDGVVVSTAGGRIKARAVVIATGYATPVFRPLAGRFRLLHTYVASTRRRVSGAERNRLPGRRVMLWDTSRPYCYLRWTADGRILFGGADRPVRGGRSSRRRMKQGSATLVTRLQQWYPVLTDADFDLAWEGLFAQTPDGLPYIGPHRRYPRHLFALGYGGNGMSVSYLAARILLRHYQGAATKDDDLFGFSRVT